MRGLTAPWSSLISLVMLSALGGLGISYAGFGFRSLVSATTFTLAGSAAQPASPADLSAPADLRRFWDSIMCKVATILMSQVFFDNKASMTGVACLGVCVAGATLYKPAADRPKATTPLPVAMQPMPMKS